jgi:hypothetical protein
MKFHSIATPHGSAAIVEIVPPFHPINLPPGYGAILWGRCERSDLLTIALGLRAEWVADYRVKTRDAIVVWSNKPGVTVGGIFVVDTTCVDAICPHCGSSEYSSAAQNWLCSKCGKRWRKAEAKPRGGAGRRQGRKVTAT